MGLPVAMRICRCHPRVIFKPVPLIGGGVSLVLRVTGDTINSKITILHGIVIGFQSAFKIDAEKGPFSLSRTRDATRNKKTICHHSPKYSRSVDQFWGCVEQAEFELAVEDTHMQWLVVEQAAPELSGGRGGRFFAAACDRVRA